MSFYSVLLFLMVSFDTVYTLCYSRYYLCTDRSGCCPNGYTCSSGSYCYRYSSTRYYVSVPTYTYSSSSDSDSGGSAGMIAGIILACVSFVCCVAGCCKKASLEPKRRRIGVARPPPLRVKEQEKITQPKIEQEKNPPQQSETQKKQSKITKLSLERTMQIPGENIRLEKTAQRPEETIARVYTIGNIMKSESLVCESGKSKF